MKEFRNKLANLLGDRTNRITYQTLSIRIILKCSILQLTVLAFFLVFTKLFNPPIPVVCLIVLPLMYLLSLLSFLQFNALPTKLELVTFQVAVSVLYTVAVGLVTVNVVVSICVIVAVFICSTYLAYSSGEKSGNFDTLGATVSTKYEDLESTLDLVDSPQEEQLPETEYSMEPEVSQIDYSTEEYARTLTPVEAIIIGEDGYREESLEREVHHKGESPKGEEYLEREESYKGEVINNGPNITTPPQEEKTVIDEEEVVEGRHIRPRIEDEDQAYDSSK